MTAQAKRLSEMEERVQILEQQVHELALALSIVLLRLDEEKPVVRTPMLGSRRLHT